MDHRTANERPHWLDKPQNVKLLWRVFLALLGILVLLELLVRLHPDFAVESVFGFHAWFGFLACAAMIAVAKGLALWLKRPDGYYGGQDD